MEIKGKEILEELKLVVSGRTFDALLPPLLFVLFNGLWGLDTATLLSLAVATGIGINRLVRRQNWKYAAGGFLGTLVAAGFSYLTRSAAGYFIPSLAGSGFLLLLALVTLFADRPLAAWASHLTRGWPLEWYWRGDVKPAYREVTWLWTGYLLLRFLLQLLVFRTGNVVLLAWAGAVTGWPVIVPVLIISYIYGIWRLRQLEGPGVQEFTEGKTPPWNGQTRGF